LTSEFDQTVEYLQIHKVAASPLDGFSITIIVVSRTPSQPLLRERTPTSTLRLGLLDVDVVPHHLFEHCRKAR